jgi:phage/plasmid-associated DNA primase
MIDGPVARFVDVQCDVGDSNLILAKELYEGFQAWCRETGQDDVSQRSFGMQLTAMGFQRRRRGRGKHWWHGIRLAATAVPVIEETMVERSPVLANGHYEGYQAELPT